MVREKIVRDKKKVFGKLETRKSGRDEGHLYQEYKDSDGKWKSTHRRTMEKRYFQGEKIPKSFQVHHIDGNPTNNRPGNLILLHIKDHGRVHSKKDRLHITNKLKRDEYFTEEEIEEVIKKLERLTKEMKSASEGKQ
jgi:hypothetical protein